MSDIVERLRESVRACRALDRSMLLEEAAVEIERLRIGNSLCPKCGEKVKDKGSYIRCTRCDWCLSDGTWGAEGYVIDCDPDSD